METFIFCIYYNVNRGAFLLSSTLNYLVRIRLREEKKKYTREEDNVTSRKHANTKIFEYGAEKSAHYGQRANNEIVITPCKKRKQIWLLSLVKFRVESGTLLCSWKE